MSTAERAVVTVRVDAELKIKLEAFAYVTA
jgi:hypothetical protein